MKNEVSKNPRSNEVEVREKPDTLAKVKGMFGFLDEHPEVGVIAGGTLTASGISAMVVYGIKCARA